MSEAAPGRDVLPIPGRAYSGLTTYDAKDPDTAFPAIEPLRPPEGAPNVLIVLIDDHLGSDTSSAVSGDYTPAESRFNGVVNWVQIDLEGEDADHFISPEERLRVAMARQ